VVLGLRPLREDMRLSFGTAIHAGLEAFYGWAVGPAADLLCDERLDATQQAFQVSMLRQLKRVPEELKDDDYLQAWNEHMALGGAMLDRYCDYAAQHDDFQVLATEHILRVPVLRPDGRATRGIFTAKIDMLVRTNDGRLWVWENKTAASVISEFALDMDDQITRYAWAVQQTREEEVAGIYYNTLIKAVSRPKEPVGVSKKNPLGKMSIDRGQVTDLAAWEAMARTHGIPVYDEQTDMPLPEYAEFMDWLGSQPDRFIHRHKTYRSQTELANTGLQMYDELLDMRLAVNRQRIYRSVSRDCEWKCPYKDLCRATYDGDDCSYIIDSQFTRPEERGTAA